MKAIEGADAGQAGPLDPSGSEQLATPAVDWKGRLFQLHCRHQGKILRTFKWRVQEGTCVLLEASELGKCIISLTVESTCSQTPLPVGPRSVSFVGSPASGA